MFRISKKYTKVWEIRSNDGILKAKVTPKIIEGWLKSGYIQMLDANTAIFVDDFKWEVKGIEVYFWSDDTIRQKVVDT